MKTGSADIAALNLAPEGNLELGDDRRSSSNGRRSIVVDLFKRRAKKVQDYLSFRLRSREDGEDAMQDAFLKMWRREVAGALQEKADSYLYSTALSVATDAERQRTVQARERFVEADLDDIPRHAPSQEDHLHWRQAMAHFVYSVKALPELTRNIFVLHHVEGLRYPEIARRFGISTRTVERHIAQAFLELQGKMGDYL